MRLYSIICIPDFDRQLHRQRYCCAVRLTMRCSPPLLDQFNDHFDDEMANKGNPKRSNPFSYHSSSLHFYPWIQAELPLFLHIRVLFCNFYRNFSNLRGGVTGPSWSFLRALPTGTVAILKSLSFARNYPEAEA
jgi:hypothetical protein